jgi:hypothetical protein
MTEHKATPEQWATVEKQSIPPMVGLHQCAHGGEESIFSTVIELRDRLESLESTLRATRIDLIRLANATAEIAPNKAAFHAATISDEGDEAISESENDRRFRAALAAIDSATPEQILAMTADHIVDPNNKVATDDALMRRYSQAVTDAIQRGANNSV